MIKGIGTDIIEINRVGELISNIKFMMRYFTDAEINYIYERSNGAESAAAIFAAKESMAKAIGTGFVGFEPKEIEVIHAENGKPSIVLHDRAELAAKRHGIKNIQLSMSHCRQYAEAFVIAEGDEL